MTRAASNPANCSFAKSEIEFGLAERRGSDSDHRADISAKAILLGPIVLGDGPGVRPGAKEQRQEAPLEDVDETGEGVIPFAKPGVCLVGDRKGQGALGPKHSQEFRLEPNPAGRDLRAF